MDWIFEFVNAQPWQMRAFIVGGAAIAACLALLRVLLWLGDLSTRKRWREQRQAERLARVGVGGTPYASEYQRREHPDSEILPCLPNTGGAVERKPPELQAPHWFEGLAQAGPLLGAAIGGAWPNTIKIPCANCAKPTDKCFANEVQGQYFCSEKCLRWFVQFRRDFKDARIIKRGDKSKI